MTAKLQANMLLVPMPSFFPILKKLFPLYFKEDLTKDLKYSVFPNLIGEEIPTGLYQQLGSSSEDDSVCIS